MAARVRPTSAWTTSVSSVVMVRAIGLFACRGEAVVLHVELDPHRLLARVFLRDFRGESGDAADDEQEAAGRGSEAHVVENGGERAVDVHRQYLDPPRRLRLERFHEQHAV